MNKENIFYPAVNEGLSILKTLLNFGFVALLFLLVLGVIIKMFKK